MGGKKRKTGFLTLQEAGAGGPEDRERVGKVV
jgi:hypothetical protein